MDTGKANPETSPAETCQFCFCATGTADGLTACPECHSVYHTECWEENGGCAVYGCEAAATPPARQDIEIPASYWGREHKDCPACGEEIMATALRCRHCGEIFASADPRTASEVEAIAGLEAKLGRMKKATVVFLILGVLPFTAPLAVLFGMLWYLPQRKVFPKLPPLNKTFFWIGMVVGLGQTLFLLLTGFLANLLGT